MHAPMLHHISLVATDLERSIAFYRDVMGLTQVPRPPFAVAGAWMVAGAIEIHLLDNPNGTFRRSGVIDTADCHFAIRVTDFEATVADLARHGYDEAAALDDPRRLLVIRNGIAGFPQAYLLDPDGHVIEINATA